MVFAIEKAVGLLLLMLPRPWTEVATLVEAKDNNRDNLSAVSGRSAEFIAVWPAPTSIPEAVKSGSSPSGPVGPASVSTDHSAPGRSTGLKSTPHPLSNEVPLPGHSGPSQTPHGAFTRDVRGSDPVCSNGLRLAFDCALKRVTAFGVRDHLVEKYKLPMVPLDVCQGDMLVDIEQCIPEDFMDTFPSDTLLEVCFRPAAACPGASCGTAAAENSRRWT